MRVNPEMAYYDGNGVPTVQLSIADQAQIESYLVEKTTLATFPSQPGDAREWHERDIYRHFAPDRYLWGRTVRNAIVLLARDCRTLDKRQRS
jgi:hypothetical protein